MEPEIRYVRSADGTRVATCTVGEGQPLVFVRNFYGTIELLWEIPEALKNIERLSEKRMVVFYDARGAGLSAQHVADFSLDAHVGDLEAVVDALDSATVDLMCEGPTTAIGITYATRHAEKVRKLVLRSPAASGRHAMTEDRRRVLVPLAAIDWPLYLQCVALLNFGWTEVGRRVAEKQAKEANRGVWARSIEEWSRYDVASLVPLVLCPTLVLDPRPGSRLAELTEGRVFSSEIAAAMPNARLTRFDQDHSLMFAGSWDSCLRIIEEFLDENGKQAEEQSLPSGTAIILFADIAESTALTERLGDAAFREKARELDESLRRAITSNGGTAIDGKLLGDGVLATFGAAREAIACAMAIHAAGSHTGLPLHVGIHAGDVIRESNNVYGGAVNIASRVASEAAAGETLVSRTVADLARTSSGVSFEDRGERELKGVGEPVRLYEVRWRE